MINSKKRIVALALSTGMLLSTASAFAAGDITWKVKDFFTTTGFSGTVGDGLGTGQGGPALVPAYEIVYAQYLNGVATGLVVSGEEARQYGLKPYASSITRPNSWYDLRYPNYQYEEIFADGEYTGLTWPTGARLPYTSYKNFPYMWEVGGTHKEVAMTKAYLNGEWFGSANYGYPSVYTGVNADVKEENVYFGFDVFEVFADGKARDVEVVLDTEGNGVNYSNVIKANYMVNAANANTINGSISGLVNSGNGYDSAFYAILANNLDRVVDGYFDNDTLSANKVPAFDFTGAPSDTFSYLPVQHYFQLSGPVYNKDGAVESKYGLTINAYADCVKSVPEDAVDSVVTIENQTLTQGNLNLTVDSKHKVSTVKYDEGTGCWSYDVNAERYGYYTNNLITTNTAVMAKANWVYGGYELSAPYKIYEYLTIEGITFDGDIDNDGSLDTPVVFRYNGGLADPTVEWKYAFVEAAYPHEIIVEKYVDGKATGEYKGAEKYAKENMAAVINATDKVTDIADKKVPEGHKHYKMRLEWKDNETGMLYVTPYYDFNEHMAGYISIIGTADPSYLNNPYNYVPSVDPVVVETIKGLNDANEAVAEDNVKGTVTNEAVVQEHVVKVEESVLEIVAAGEEENKEEK